MKLYQINQQLENIIESVSDTGEISTEIEKQIESLELQRKEKIQNIALLYKNLSAFADALSDEIKSLSDRKKIVQNKIEFLKNYLCNNLYENEKFSESNFALSWRKSESVEIDPILFNEKKFLEQFPDLCKVKIDVDKNATKDFIKRTGVLPEGVSLNIKNNLIIK